MIQKNKVGPGKGKLIYTALLALIICLIIVVMFAYLYSYAENNSYEQLHHHTREIKDDINIQMQSDRENLMTMANFASKLYSDGDSYDLMFRSFQKIGLIENIGILTEDNTFITKTGFFNVHEGLDFDEEAKKGMYVSGLEGDIINTSTRLIRSAVPIVAEGRTVGILYGAIDPSDMENRYADTLESIGARLIIVEGGSGNYLIDTGKIRSGNITGLASAPFKENFSYKTLIEDITHGQSGYTAFKPHTQDEYYYAHYAPTEISDWRVILLRPEAVVFASTRETGAYILIMLLAVILIMILYIVLVLMSEKRVVSINTAASVIRKRLLEVNQQFDSFEEALKNLCDYSKARSAFFVDNLGGSYKYMTEDTEKYAFAKADREKLVNMLMEYSARKRGKRGLDVYSFSLAVNKKTKKNFYSFYSFAKMHGIKNVYFTITMRSNNYTGMLGIIDTRRKYVSELLREISVCFSMAVYNKNHLITTEEMALTDSLTGASNRMAYKNYLKTLKNKIVKRVSCVYIDVNELHSFNNKYGHAAGDQMLVFVAETLKKHFENSTLYRMGGDEFLIIDLELTDEEIKERTDNVLRDVDEMKYHISVGIESGKNVGNVEEMVSKAEKLMFEDKAKYYQNKERERNPMLATRDVKINITGKKDVDAALAAMSSRYVGVYYVSFKKNTSSYLLTPEYYSMEQSSNETFLDVMTRYIHEIAKPEYHRTLSTVLDFEYLERQIREGQHLKFSYTNISGDKIILSIHPAAGTVDDDSYALWIFERDL